MALGKSRVALVGESPYPHEQEAIKFAIDSLPNVDPFHLWALIDLVEPSSGRLHEIDLLIIGYSAIYLVEVKSGPGTYVGDSVDWWRTPPGETRSRWMDPPRKLANLKAKVVKSLLGYKLKDASKVPWIEPLVFLSHEDVTLRLEPDGVNGVVTRGTFRKAIASHIFPGAPTDWRAQRINQTRMRDVVKGLESIGFRKRKGKAHVGPYELGEVLAEGQGYQDREAVHRDQERLRRRARIYLVPQATSVEMRQKLRRAADREAMLLHEVREHRNVLSCTEYVTDAPLGPTVLFDAFDGGVPLDTFLRANPDLSIESRVEIIDQVGQALAFCHRREVYHGALTPESVLVRRASSDGPVEVRIFNFQLGSSKTVTPTSHWTSLTDEAWFYYSAPELHENPSRLTSQSDLFSLGALAYFVLTGRHPASNAKDFIEIISRDRHLDPRVVDESIPADLADVVAMATGLVAASRGDDVDAWLELFEEAATEPAPKDVEEEVNPLEARPEAILGDDLIVSRVLGHGASSRVLRVERVTDDRSFALKVSLLPEHDERLAAEAAVLRELRHPQIVALIDERTFAGRPCLLLSLAGEMTLHRELAQRGSVGLDYASRYGEDLLSALEHLESKQVVHRDLKPANVGVGAVGKEGHHLTLFDFSLVQAPLGEITLGTAAYRDPFLRERGQWDSAADRWSAAVTLHEMLTGVRPSYGGPGGTTLDLEAELTLAAERFDPSVREQLVSFFERALARDIEHRYDSAVAMRHAWIAALDAQRLSAPPGAPEPAEPTIEQLAAIGPETPIELLPLTPKARNALDRAGLERAEQLLALPDNRLSMIRGIGTAVAVEILGFRERWQQARQLEAPDARPFFPGYLGEDLRLAEVEVDAVLAATLRDAGLATLGAVASASADQVEALGRRAIGEESGSGTGSGTGSGLTQPLRALLADENRKADEAAHPSTLEGWLNALLAKRNSGMKHPRALFGLDEPFAGRLDVSVKELAEKRGISRAAVYTALVKSRAVWADHGAINELTEVCREVLLRAGGALPLDRAAAELLSHLPHDRSVPEAERNVRAAALWRVVTELEKDDPTGLGLRRLADGSPWIFASEAHGSVVGDLGKAADDLARRTVPATYGEVSRVLGHIVAETPLVSLSPDRLVDLAVAASSNAARSARLEIYPRGMDPERAFNLCAGLMQSGFSLDQVHAKVRARYPEAAPLPDRPELDRLMERHGFKWNDALGVYERPDHHFATTLNTTFSSLTRMPRPRPLKGQPLDTKLVVSESFDERLRVTVERRGFRLLAVTADRANEAALALSKRLNVPPTSFDDLMLEELAHQMPKRRIKREVVMEADAEGPTGRAWTNLLKLTGSAAEAVAGKILPPTSQPLLLVRPGLIARYQLEAFLTALVEASKLDEAQAIFLLAPSHDVGGVPRINGVMPVPGILASQALWIPRPWLSDVLGDGDLAQRR